MISDFNTLISLDMTGHTSKKPTFKFDKASNTMKETDVKLDYLNWADCLELLHQNGAEKVTFGNVRSAEDHPLFLLNGGIPFIRVFVDIDGDRRELDYPLIDGAKDIKVENAAQSDIHNATQRAFVKCVGINWGLGLSLWQKEEKEAPPPQLKDDPMSHNLFVIKERIGVLITGLMKKGLSKKEICDYLGIPEKRLDMIMDAYFTDINALETKLRNYDKKS